MNKLRLIYFFVAMCLLLPSTKAGYVTDSLYKQRQIQRESDRKFFENMQQQQSHDQMMMNLLLQQQMLNNQNNNSQWKPGVAHSQYPHVVTSTEVGKWTTESGYKFISDESDNFDVEWCKGLTHSSIPNLISGEIEGQWYFSCSELSSPTEIMGVTLLMQIATANSINEYYTAQLNLQQKMIKNKEIESEDLALLFSKKSEMESMMKIIDQVDKMHEQNLIKGVFFDSSYNNFSDISKELRETFNKATTSYEDLVKKTDLEEKIKEYERKKTAGKL